MITTVIANRVPISEKLFDTKPTNEILASMTQGRVESCSSYLDGIIPTAYHGLIQTAQLAFDRHYPLVLTPDAIWLTITQGVATHINQNAEELRKEFVCHEGKATIVVRRDEFRKNSPENDWPGVFWDFSDQIRAHIGDVTHERFIADFSTTGPVEKAASEIVLMDAMKSYFDYLCKTMCGIPYIALEGTVDDWEKIAQRTDEFGRYGLNWYTDVAVDIIQNIIEGVKGNGKESFFADAFNEGGGSGGPYYNGWLVKLLPYIKDWRGTVRKNHLVEAHASKRSFMHGLCPEDMPSSLSLCPFKWEYYAQEFDMRFVAGIAGAKQDPDSFALRPNIAWAVQDMADVKQPVESR